MRRVGNRRNECSARRRRRDPSTVVGQLLRLRAVTEHAVKDQLTSEQLAPQIINGIFRFDFPFDPF